jgi:hypothetical protein
MVYLVPDTCWPTVQKKNSVSANITKDTIKNDENGTRFYYFQTICFLFAYTYFLNHLDFQYSKQGANPRRIGDRLVWAVRSNDLAHWATQAPENVDI